jgi:hypothetical protein
MWIAVALACIHASGFYAGVVACFGYGKQKRSKARSQKAEKEESLNSQRVCSFVNAYQLRIGF